MFACKAIFRLFLIVMFLFISFIFSYFLARISQNVKVFLISTNNIDVFFFTVCRLVFWLFWFHILRQDVFLFIIYDCSFDNLLILKLICLF